MTVTLPGSFGAFPGDRVTVRLEKLGLTGNYRVAETETGFRQRRSRDDLDIEGVWLKCGWHRA